MIILKVNKEECVGVRARFSFPGHAGVRGSEMSTSSQETVLFNGLLDHSLFWGVSRQNIRRKIQRWMENQHLVLWHVPWSTQTLARELISGPDLATRVRLLSFNTTQSRVVIGLLTGHNTLRRHLYIIGLSNNSICRKCGTEERKPHSSFCVSVRPWRRSDIHIWILSLWTLRIWEN
jgi:hypothetical protein